MHRIYTYSGTLTILWFILIFILCATPGQYIPSSTWLEMLSVDKWIHAFIFFVLTALMFLTVLKHKKSNALIAFSLLCCILYGAGLEWMQANYFTNRSADWQDIVANSLGSLMALFILKKLRTTHFKIANNA